MLVKLVEHFTDTPGGRYISDGPYSGELFRKQFMEPFFEIITTQQATMPMVK